jgi:hypothetical protein
VAKRDAEARSLFLPHDCGLTKDKWASKIFELPPWQADFIVRQAFGWERADGTRLYRRVNLDPAQNFPRSRTPGLLRISPIDARQQISKLRS